MNVNEWVKRCHEIAVAHGWWDEEESIGQKIALMHAELSEALEQARDGRPGVYYPCNAGGLCTEDENRPGDHISCRSRVYNPDDPEGHCMARSKKPEGIYVELVDCVIRIFDYLGDEGADVEAILAEKCAYNETRPYRHGKKF